MTGNFSLEALARLPEFNSPVASPDGEHVAVYYDGTGRNELHLVDVSTGETRQVSDGEVPRNARHPLEWGPDSDRIYFHLDDAGDEQNDIWEMDLDGNAAPVVEDSGQCRLTDVHDGTLLYTSSAGGQMNLYRYDRETGTSERLTEYDFGAYSGLSAPDGDRIVYMTNESDDMANIDVYIADADGSNPRTLEIGVDGSESYAVDWSPDGTKLLVADNAPDKTHCGVYDLETKSVEWFGDGEYVEDAIAFLPDENGFLALRRRRAAVVPLVYDFDGTATELDMPTGVASFTSYGDAALVGDSRVLVQETTPTQRPALLVHDLESGETETLIEPVYGDIDPETFTDAEYVTFESHDGTEIGGLLYDSGERPSKAVVKVHGGPASQDLRSFKRRTQFFLDRGYTVLEVNYRGSTGRGREFKNSLIGDWGGAEQDDVAEGARWLRNKDWIDEDEVIVYGGSYGGYSAYWQMVRYPELYAAGIAWVGVTDLHDMHENTMPHFQTGLMEKYMGDPDENHDLYRERSPVEYTENLSSPLLMVHGVNDRRVPVSQARLFRDALEEDGFVKGEDEDFEYVELGEEGHGSTDIEQKIRSMELVADFLDRRVAAN
ncbi:prolyl oligopeptidase family serine peptidase [Haladaptatus sp. AB618]|uniref:S9 family peptidase n=1 Tax=Haladaptatus sp. AB618 TaxID=2934173 RepID=UPI00209C4632|nr:prolyl oligopeptidase family serine peptidase [Haladaptatus sp. AB618]MCO8256499.1 prolyl oligopeptidase family serine peptidase [Haladaptatus sp. AB618]